MIIGLVSCCKKKRSTPMAAALLYNEKSFYRAALHAQTTCDRWVILSGKHEVLNPEQVVAPYNLDLRKQRPAYIKRWAANVNRTLRRRFPDAGFVAMVDGPYLLALRELHYVIKEIK